MARITKKAADALTARQREYMLWDDDIKGFGVRVHPSGRKVYLVKYRHHGRVVKRTIGPHGTISPAAARALAAEIVTAAKTGRDLMGRVSAAASGRRRDHARPRQAVPGGIRPGPLQAKHRAQLRDRGPAARAAPARQPTGRRRHPRRRGRPASPDAQDSLRRQPHHRDPVRDVHRGRALGTEAAGLQPVPVREAVPGKEARAVPVRRGVPAPRRGTARGRAHRRRGRPRPSPPSGC